MKLFWVLILLACNVSAEKFFYEQEPNNSPIDGNHFKSEQTILGNMQGKDQDMFIWNVSDGDADFQWNIEFEGLPGKLTRLDLMHVTLTEDEKGVTQADTIFSMASPDGSVPLQASKLVVTPGKYYLGLSYAGGQSKPSVSPLFGDMGFADMESEIHQENIRIDSIDVKEQDFYKIRITKGYKINLARIKEDKNSKESPYSLRADSMVGVYFYSKSLWLDFKINEKQTNQVWKVHGQSELGKPLTLKLYDSANNLLATQPSDKRGAFYISDLKLSVGSYLLELISQDSSTAIIEVANTGEFVSGNEAEPNNNLKIANQIKVGETIIGKLSGNTDEDSFVFNVNDELSQKQLKLSIINDNKENLRFCLWADNQKRLKCNDTKEDIILDNLALNVGNHFISLSRSANEAPYSINVADVGPRNPIMETEPNDSFPQAVAMNEKRLVKGTTVGNEYDFYKFDVDDSDRMWTIQAVGSNLDRLMTYNARGDAIQRATNQAKSNRLKLSNLILSPGEHIVSLNGTDSKYVLRAFPAGKIDESLEREPNDSELQATALNIGETKKGLLADANDVDLYHFRINGEQGLHLKIQPPVDGALSYQLDREGVRVGRKVSQKGEAVEFKGLLKPGEYQIRIQPHRDLSDDLYEVSLNTYDAYSCREDCEPNDNPYQANNMSGVSVVKGQSGTHDDYDWYFLPESDVQRKITFVDKVGNNIAGIVGFTDYGKTSLVTERNSKEQLIDFTIPVNKAGYFRIQVSKSNYEFDIKIDNQAVQEQIITADVNLSVSGLPESIKAFAPESQRLKGQIMVENKGHEIVDIHLKIHTGDYRWITDISTDELQLQPGEAKQIPISILTPAELTDSIITRIVFVAETEGVVVKQYLHEIKAETNADLVNPEEFWGVQKSLIGGINVAALSMGAKRTEEDIAMNVSSVGYGFDELFDNMTALNSGLKYRGGRKTEKDIVTIEFAGNKPVDVVGTILNPLSGGSSYKYLKDFELHLSLDGVNFQNVLQGSLQPVGAEQSFVLSQPYKARFARLYMINSQDDIVKTNLSLGEWKVIAAPDTVFDSFNITSPNHGGFVVWSKPQISGDWDKPILTEELEHASARSRSNDDWQWVVGFHNQRAALIEKIQWLPSQADTGNRSNVESMKSVKVFVSSTSNVGPWQLVADEKLDTDKSLKEITFEKPVWARYVKFVTDNVKISNYAYFPETIRILEKQVGSDYQSILGEWGELSHQALYEKLNPANKLTVKDERQNHSKNTAFDISEEKTTKGQVQLEYADKPDWFKFSVAEDHNTLNIGLSGKQTVETVLHIEDEQGIQLPLLTVAKETNLIQYQLPVESGKNYFIKVEEPPRSTVFVWDTSPSTLSYEDIIYQALNSYSNEVIPDRDMVNFLPFGGELLMDQWYGEPYYLKTIINSYSRKDDSSQAEWSLSQATKALAGRQGSKAIILITDALTNRTPEVWDSLREVHPRVFSLGLVGTPGFGGKLQDQVDLLQSWAHVNNGEFIKVVDRNDADQAFARAAAKLRMPADYQLVVDSEYIKQPGPGQLQISQSASSQSGGAVELILDASGSMLKRLNGNRRINIAKDVLKNTVTEVIPQGTPVALRVFGDKEANACRTDLAIKLQPLQPQAAVKVIDSINAKNLAKTPIADSLAKVAGDLKSHQGQKIVILVTDGEETCDGNPQEVIAKLIEDGMDIRLNIVGFAIDDEELKEQFQQWSTQGGGKYFDSNNPESLKQSVNEALKVPYSVFDRNGELVSEGTVNGEPIELPAGYYTIKIFTQEVQVIENYQILGEQLQRVEL